MGFVDDDQSCNNGQRLDSQKSSQMNARQSLHLVARWETQDPACWIELRHDGQCYWLYTEVMEKASHKDLIRDEDAIKAIEETIKGMEKGLVGSKFKHKRVY